jgi:phosphoglucomutase
VQVTATAKQKQQLAALSSHDVTATNLAGEKIDRIIDHAPGDDAPIGGIKVSTASGWFAARPSGTEDIYKIYAESFHGPEQLQRILKEAQVTVDSVIARS